MKRVFIIQDNGGRDFSDARRFGELVPLIQRDAFPDDAEERVEVIKQIVQSKLEDYNPLADSILLTGDPLAIVIVGALAFIASTEVAFLKWDKENRRYYRVVVRV